MKIGIDIDEVIAEQLDHIIKFYHKKTGKLIPKEKFTTYNWWEVWGITREEAIEIDHEFKRSNLFDEINPIRNAIESVKSLINDNEIFIITSRPILYKERTEKWINKHLKDIPLTIIHSGDFQGDKLKTKVEICKDLGVELMIEDHAKYALECGNVGIKVILFDNPWNRDLKHKNVIRVNDWIEALKEIKKITVNTK